MKILFRVFEVSFLFLLTLFLITFVILLVKTFPARYRADANPIKFGLKGEAVTLTASDGVRVHGQWVFQDAKQPIIILCHGMETTKEDLYPLARNLSYNGWNIFLLDFRAHGESEGRTTSFGLWEQRDLISVLDFLNHDIRFSNPKIGVYGVSMGAVTALLTAAKDKRIQAVVADSPYEDFEALFLRKLSNDYHLPEFPFNFFLRASFHLRFHEDIHSLSVVENLAFISPRPILFIFGSADSLVPGDIQALVYQAARDPKQQWIVPGARHGEAQQRDSEGFENTVSDFFQKALNPA